MNRNFELNNGPDKNHYADFDEHGNSRTGNTNSLSRYNPARGYSSFGQHRENDRYGNRDTNAAHAYGDYSRGTRYGEGGSNEGGGSSYGHSYYGLSGNQGPRITQHDRRWSDSRQYDAYADNEHSRTRDQRFSDSFGRSSDGGYINEDRNGRYSRNYNDDSYQGSDYRNREGRNTGYDRGFSDYGDTGYGSTPYNNRDLDRERSAYSRGNQPQEDRRYSEREQHNRRYNRHQDW